MKKTVTIQIGNSDNRLTQVEWSEFIDDVNATIKAVALTVHFSGGSYPDAPWQNFCWVFDFPLKASEGFLFRLSEIKTKFRQEAIAITAGDTRML